MTKPFLILMAGLTMAATLHADVLVTRATSYTGQILGVKPDGVHIRVGDNELTIPRADVIRAEIEKPPAFDKALEAFSAGKNQEALTGFKSLADRFGGLPAAWVEESLTRLSEVQLALKDFAGARKSLDMFRTLYPKSPVTATLDSKYARIYFEQKETDKALPLVQKVLEPLLKIEALTDEQENAVAESLILLGDCLAATNKLDDALDAYLKVVALYDVDALRTAEARYKAGKIFEQRNNWRRAKQNYEDVLRDTPDVAFADDVKKRLAAHPE
jgi:tetratricopeptide (TPR) repeat protein